MRDLNYSIKRIVFANREGSFSTVNERARNLDLIARQIHELGFPHLKGPAQFKPKHIDALVSHWKNTEISAAVQKNRMSHIRWLLGKIDRESIVAKDNEHYGIEKRQYVSNEDRAVKFDDDRLDKIQNRHVKAAALLQKTFGLRRQEAMKFIPDFAIRGDHIRLKGSWTKGGKEREIPIRNDEQRQVLEHVKTVAGTGSLIPSNLPYVKQMKIFEHEMSKVGLGRSHGARHFYAQQRYQELTGRLAPACGGPRVKTLSWEERQADEKARLTISRELGHERPQIVAVYVGS